MRKYKQTIFLLMILVIIFNSLIRYINIDTDKDHSKIASRLSFSVEKSDGRIFIEVT